jgi:alkylation response protein AidB-like acyl-CoA dehydrogenase
VNFDDSPEEASFRAELRAWLAGNAPSGPRPDTDDERFAELTRWHKALHAGGWMGLSWPVEHGGRGLSQTFEAIFNDEVGAAGAPDPPHIGFLGRAILQYGTDEQRGRFLPGLLSGDEVWCQGFSEPNAGSDLASLRTRATLDGDHYVVSGQKVWTSDAQYADWCLFLARTDADAPKHKGISAFVVRMDTPGITVRPLVQITGSREFCEVFYDDVVVPADQLVGQPGQGWSLAMTTVAFERGPADIGFTSRYRRSLKRLEDAARAGELRDDPALRVQLARAYVDVEVLRLHVLRSLSSRTGDPGPEGSIDKLLMTRTEQRLAHTAMDLLGAAPHLDREDEWLHTYLFSRGQSIMGGTEQVQKNIVAQRVLGLPRG